MAIVNEDVEQEFAPQKKKPLSEDEKRKKKIVAGNLRKKKIVVGSLMKALIRPGGGDSGPSNSDQVLEANPAHVKGLYGRGMVYMGNGDFEEARADFKMEVEKKARKQFKGLFGKKRVEIAEVKANYDENQVTSEILKDGEVLRDSSDGTNSEDSHEAAPDADQRG